MTTEDTGADRPRVYRLPRRPENSLGLGFTNLAQTLILAVSTGVAVLCLMLSSSLSILLALVAWMVGAAVAFAKVSGKPLYYWVPVGISFLLRQSRGDGQVADELSSRRSPPPTADPPPAFRRLVPQFKVIGVPYRNGTIAVMRLGKRDRYAIGCTVNAGAFVTLSSLAQDQVLLDWSRLLDGIARRDSVITDFSWFAATQPPATVGHERMYAQRSTMPLDVGLVPYDEVVDMAAQANTHEITLLIETTGPVALRAAGLRRARGRKAEEAIQRTLIEAFERLATSLVNMGVTNIRPLSPARLAGRIRYALEPYELPEAARDTDARVQTVLELVVANGQRPKSSNVTADDRSMWPIAAEELGNRVTAGDTLHQVFIVEEYPPTGVTADMLLPLLNDTTTPRTVVMRARPLPSSPSERRLTWKQNAADSEFEDAASRGTRLRRSKHTQHSLREAQLDELEDGATLWSWIMLIDVAGDTEDTLRRNVADVREVARQCGLVLRSASFRQLEALLMCLPLPSIEK